MKNQAKRSHDPPQAESNVLHGTYPYIFYYYLKPGSFEWKNAMIEETGVPFIAEDSDNAIHVFYIIKKDDGKLVLKDARVPSELTD